MQEFNAEQEIHYEEGRLPMSEDELVAMERNHRLTRRVMVPMMALLGTSGLAGGVFVWTTGVLAVGIGLAASSVIMLGFAAYYLKDTKQSVERPEKFFVSGVVTGKRKTGSAFTQVYYQVTLSGGRHVCYLREADYNKINPGDLIQCERLLETSVDADRVVVLRSAR